MPKSDVVRRTKVMWNRKDSAALLRNADRSITVFVKLKEDGRVALDIFWPGQQERKEFTPKAGWSERKPVPKERKWNDVCGKCGQNWAVHNDDGSCVSDAA